MKATELIKQLETLVKEHGDLPVYRHKYNGSFAEYTNELSIAFTKTKKGRELIVRKWQTWNGIESKNLKTIEL